MTTTAPSAAVELLAESTSKIDAFTFAGGGSFTGAVPGASGLLWAVPHPRLLGGLRAG